MNEVFKSRFLCRCRGGCLNSLILRHIMTQFSTIESGRIVLITWVIILKSKVPKIDVRLTVWRHQSKDLAQGFVHSVQHPGTSWSLPRVLPESRLIQERRAALEAPKATPWYRVGGVHLVHPVRYKDNHGTMLSLVSIWSSRSPS